MSQRIYAVSGTRKLFLEDRRLIIMALEIEGLKDRQSDYDEMHHGNAEGVDKFLAGLFTEWGYNVVPHDADWKRYGRKAGPIRNREMLESANPETLFAFPGAASARRDRSVGTIDCINAAAAREIDMKVWWLR